MPTLTLNLEVDEELPRLQALQFVRDPVRKRRVGTRVPLVGAGLLGPLKLTDHVRAHLETVLEAMNRWSPEAAPTKILDSILANGNRPIDGVIQGYAVDHLREELNRALPEVGLRFSLPHHGHKTQLWVREVKRSKRG